MVHGVFILLLHAASSNMIGCPNLNKLKCNFIKTVESTFQIVYLIFQMNNKNIYIFFSLQNCFLYILTYICNIHNTKTQKACMAFALAWFQLNHHTPQLHSLEHSFLSRERLACQQCSGSIPKVSKLTHGNERIVNGLPPTRGQSEWGVLFGQLSWGPSPPNRKRWRDRQTDRQGNQMNWQKNR